MHRSSTVLSLVTLALAIALPAPVSAKRPHGLRDHVRVAAEAESDEARRAAVAAVVRHGDAAVDLLFVLLRRGVPAETRVATEALPAIGGEAVALRAKRRYGRLQERPTPDNAAERRALLVILARTADPSPVALVADALHDDALRDTAKAELVRMGPGAARELVIRASQQPESAQLAAIEVLATMPEAAAPLVVPLFQRPSDEASRFAGMLLSELKDPRIVPQLVALVRERKAHDEADVLRALAIYDVPAARDAVRDALASPFPYLRFAAVEVVRGWSDDAGLALVRERLREMARGDEAEDVQAAAIRTLLAHWDTGAVELLGDVVEDEDAPPRARAAAAEALGFLASGEVAIDLVRLLEAAPASPVLAPALRAALRRLTYRPAAAPPERFRLPPPAAAALGDPLDLEPLDDAPAPPPAVAAAGGPAVLTNDADGGAVVLVLGGLPGFAAGSVAPWLGTVAEGRRIVAVTLPAPRGEAATTLAWEQAFDTWIGALRAHLRVEAVSVVGHGVGGLLALRYTARHPDRVIRLVLVGTPLPRSAAWDAWLAASLRALPKDALGDLALLRTGWQGAPPRAATRGAWRVLAPALFHDAPNAALVRDAAGPDDLGRARLAAVGPFDMRPDLDALAIPTLVIVGESDPLPAEQRAVYRARHEETGGRQRFVELEGAGHFPHLEQPAAFRAELEAWLPRAP